MRKLLWLLALAACTPKPQYPECKTDPDCAEHGQVCLSGFCKPGKACVDRVCKEGNVAASQATRLLGECEIKAVYFGFDDASLDPDARKQLDLDFTCLQKTPLRRVRLEGHTDERGTTEYNLALGEHRAAAVRKYLARPGIEPRKLKAISYGKERPAHPGHDEAAWARNRRVELAPEPWCERQVPVQP